MTRESATSFHEVKLSRSISAWLRTTPEGRLEVSLQEIGFNNITISEAEVLALIEAVNTHLAAT